MQRFEVLPHTADVAVRAQGSTRAALLAAALQGMFAAAAPRERADAASAEQPFAVSAADFPALLVDVLNEAIALADIHIEAYDAFRFDLITEKEARGAFVGRAVAGFDTQLKAATYHGLVVARNAEGLWEATVIFDV